uniref:Uncharacterized protein n=1 Tax=Setaria italica TaxID=4555 RepID=K4A012_SETIT
MPSAMVVWDLYNVLSFFPEGQLSYIPHPRGTNIEQAAGSARRKHPGPPVDMMN